MNVTRRTAMQSAAAFAASPALGQEPAPRLVRYIGATFGAVDVDRTVELYRRAFGYRVVERTTIDPGLAASWGTPHMAGRAFAVLGPASGDRSYVRVVSLDPVPGFEAITTLGWTSIEFVCDDPDRVERGLTELPFKVIGAPAQLGSFPTIRAMQVAGPDHEVIHITSETGDQATSPLPPPPKDGGVGRIFIIVLAVADVPAAATWYAETFSLKRNPIRSSPISIINHTQGLPEDHASAATFMRMSEQGNSLEFWSFDGAAAAPRPRNTDQLPPGVSIATLAVRNLDELTSVTWIAPPAVRRGVMYAGKRAATCLGPTGELLELVEV
ncbi:MAG: VOC family protein [Rhodobacteraceae bacterium]|nr:VOC family protein [Paracoccaceae bacterium]